MLQLMPPWAGAAAEWAARQAVPVSRWAPGGLSPRERQIVALVTAGLTNRAIANQLVISERTVDTHIARIRQKLGTTTRTQLAVWGLEHREPTVGPNDASGR